MTIEKWGNPITTSQVAATDKGQSYFGTVAALPNGGQVVVWSYMVGSQYTTCFRIIDGLGRSGAIQTVTASAGSKPPNEVTVLKDGSFVITWITAGTSGESIGVKAQKFSITGVPDQAGPVTLAEPATGRTNDYPAVAANTAKGEGEWVSVWADTHDGATDNIWFRRSNGDKFTISTVSGVNKPDVVEVANGKHVVTWVQGGHVKVALVEADNTVRPSRMPSSQVAQQAPPTCRPLRHCRLVASPSAG
ncbi:hypothetical protein IC232_11845 [Microvirga sp. BT688]|uniref:hypothetical protein n=1 Tax=Microvirga sp. TaxID=1873136 RepID=UPI001688892F|nr:hypothetical protein [Microvirga sp.]MBD2747385.1 hypothetical protein [Microvirga sp.]